MNIFITLFSVMLLMLASAFGGYEFANRSNAQAIATARTEKAAVEAQLSIKNAEIENTYDAQTERLAIDTTVANVEFGRLRIETGGCMPEITSPTPGHSRAAKSQPERPRAVEIDLDRVAREIISLGSELDAANIKIAALQQVVLSCSSISL